MDFREHELVHIKNKVSSLYSYADILKLKYQGDVEKCLQDTIDLYFSDMWDVKRFIIVHNGQQIGDCKIVVNKDNNNYFVSSIAIVENLQKNWIASSLYKKWSYQKWKYCIQDLSLLLRQNKLMREKNYESQIV